MAFCMCAVICERTHIDLKDVSLGACGAHGQQAVDHLRQAACGDLACNDGGGGGDDGVVVGRGQ